MSLEDRQPRDVFTDDFFVGVMDRLWMLIRLIEQTEAPELYQVHLTIIDLYPQYTLLDIYTHGINKPPSHLNQLIGLTPLYPLLSPHLCFVSLLSLFPSVIFRVRRSS